MSKKIQNTLDSEPWRGLPVEVADLIEPELPTITEEILATIAREVPEYERPLEGRFGRGIQMGVNQALLQFVALIREPDAGRGPGREVYVELGRGEQRVGRTLDSLQAAYRIGARVAWRRIAEAGQRANLGPEPLTLLADAIFAYIDELSADSVEGYAEAQAAVEDLRRQRRQELVTLLLRERPAAADDVAATAAAAEWKLPRRLAALACSDADLAAIAGRAPVDALVTVVDGTGCVLTPRDLGAMKNSSAWQRKRRWRWVRPRSQARLGAPGVSPPRCWVPSPPASSPAPACSARKTISPISSSQPIPPSPL